MEEFQINVDDLLNTLGIKQDKGLVSFDEIVNLDGSVNRELYLGEICDGTGSSMESYIRFWNTVDDKNNVPIEDRKPIKIYIDSPGGNLTDTFMIIDAMKMSKTPIWTIATGCTYSGGFFSFIAGHKRFAYPHSSFLYHEGSTSNGGTSSQFANFAAFYKKQLDQLKDIVLDNTSIDEEKYKEIHKEDFWLTAEEALELNICDEIIKEFK